MGPLNYARIPCIQLDNPNDIRIREQHTFELDNPYLFKHDSDKFTEPTTNRPEVDPNRKLLYKIPRWKVQSKPTNISSWSQPKSESKPNNLFIPSERERERERETWNKKRGSRRDGHKEDEDNENRRNEARRGRVAGTINPIPSSMLLFCTHTHNLNLFVILNAVRREIRKKENQLKRGNLWRNSSLVGICAVHQQLQIRKLPGCILLTLTHLALSVSLSLFLFCSSGLLYAESAYKGLFGGKLPTVLCYFLITQRYCKLLSIMIEASGSFCLI